MEEILALQRKLAEVQEVSNSQRLSDRNVVEIVESIIKNFELKLLYTIDGKEYLTPEHLEQEIKEAVVARGRVNMVELPKILNMGIEQIEQRLETVCKKRGDLIMMEGQLFTNEYLDRVCEEVNEELQQRHRVNISELTMKINLPYEYLTRVVSTRLGSIIQGEIRNNQVLTTLAYTNTVRAQIRGVLRACVRPITIAQVKKTYDFEDNISEIIDDLIRKKELDGKLVSGAYVSNKFIQDQEAIVRNFFKQNDYLEYDFLQKNLFISKPKDFIKNTFKNEEGIYLETCYYSQEALSTLKQHVVDLLQSDGYVELETIIPSALNENDMETILHKYIEIKGTTLKGNIILSDEYLEKCASKFKDRATDILLGRPVKFVTAGATEEEKKGKSSKAGKKAKSKEPAERDPYDQQEVIAILRQNKLFPTDYNPELEEAFYPAVRERISDLAKKLKVELFEQKKTPLSNEVNDMQNKLEERILQMQLMLKSAKKVAEVPKLDVVYLNDCLVEFSRPVIDQFVLLYCKKYAIQLPQTVFPGNVEKQPELKRSESITECKVVILATPLAFKSLEAQVLAIDMLPKDLAKMLKNLNKLLEQKKVEEFYEDLQSNALSYGIKSLSLDKKTEKNILYSQKYFIKEAVTRKDFDEKEAFFHTLQSLLADQNLFFGLPYEQKAVEKIAVLVIHNLSTSQSNNDLVARVQEGLNFFVHGKNDELEQASGDILSKIN